MHACMKKTLIAIVILLSVFIACVCVHQFWQVAQNQVYPQRGDYDFYLKSCTSMPQHEHPIVPALLHMVNFAVRNPETSVLTLMIVGYASVFSLVFLFVFLATQNMWASLWSFIYMVMSIPNFLSLTALKNIFAVVFLLLSLIFLMQFHKTRDRKQLALLGLSSVLTCLSHSVPILVLLVVFVVYTFQYPKLLVACIGLSLLFLAMLSVTGRMRKLNFTLHNFNLGTITYNLNILMSTWKMLPYMLTFDCSMFFIVSYQAIRRHYYPVFTGLFFSVAILLLGGPEPFIIRLYETAVPILAILVGYNIHFCIKLKNEIYTEMKT